MRPFENVDKTEKSLPREIRIKTNELSQCLGLAERQILAKAWAENTMKARRRKVMQYFIRRIFHHTV